jgi:dipeptidyl aminopeptidase/acylaminoacyl peptidase
VWFDDQTGDESGSWVTSPFEGGRIERLFDSSEPGWPAGIAVGRKVIAAGRSGRDGYTIEVSSDGDEPRGLHHSTYSAWVGGSQLRGGYNLGGLSPDERLLCIEHSERGDEVRPALRVLDVRTGDVVGEQWDGEGFGLLAAAWSPVPDDQRLLVRHELEDRERPAIWDLGDGTRSRLDVDLPGDVVPLDWWPDASAVLLKHSFEGRDQLYRLSLSDQRLSRLEHAGGWVDDARVRPDGDVWLEISSGGTAPRAISIARGDVLPARDRAPDGVPFTPWRFQGRAAEVHGFFATPPNERGPFPTVMYVHGGPTWLYADSFNPEAQAFVDHGFAVGMVNYRGSTGYGRTWRDSIIGDIGFPEEEDVVAGLEDLTARGIAMPGRAAIYGRSWGGFITLLSIGRRPDRWRAAVGGVPVGDYAAGYDELSPDLQAYDRYLLGGKTPHEVPELMAERSPIVYAERVRTPTLVLVGRNDSRCPYGQAMAWVHAVRAAGGDVEVYEYDSGHSSYDVDEVVRQTKLGVDFLTSHLRAE